MWRSTCADPTISAARRLLVAMGVVALYTTRLSAQDVADLYRPSPEWRDQIIYSLMIDRFEDGDHGNNDQGANVYRRNDDAYFNGGDLAGIIRRVPYLKELGVTAVWISPPTATQWWDPATQYTGYHGYWPVHFKEIDAHFGTLADYRKLSGALHRNGMYLIQDIVVNQVGHFYNYAGGHNPADRRKNFNLNRGAIPAAPRMYPFNLVNLLEAEAATADAYHWTPSITDYSDPAQQFTHQLQLMNDLNTGNPLVRNALKDAYGFWIREVGVDAFRVDAAKHVEADFLHDFLHGPGGVMEAASATGRNDFLTFGEIFNFSDPLALNSETQISQFLGSADRPLLGSVINFPLREELRRVFISGMPTSLLAFRLREQARQFAGSERWPTFVNNHDVQRFLAEGTPEAYRLAYLLVMTAPGIPVIYQGDELGFTEIRRPIFAGIDGKGSRAFDVLTDEFGYLQSVISLRKKYPALRRGSLTILQDSSVGPGILAFRRDFDGETLYVVLNTASANGALLNGLPVGRVRLETVFVTGATNSLHPGAPIPVGDDGQLTLTLPPASAVVLRASVDKGTAFQSWVGNRGIRLDRLVGTAALEAGDQICGRTNRTSRVVRMLLNGNLDSAMPVPVGPDGRWCAQLPTISLEPRTYSVEFFDPTINAATPPLMFTGQGKVDYRMYFADPAGDDRGPAGTYRMLTDAPDNHSADIQGIGVRVNDDELELTIGVAEISNVWNYVNKFDHASFSVFIDIDPDDGASALPRLFQTMPAGARWDISHRLFGMGSIIYSAKAADEQHFGTTLPGRPIVRIDPDQRQITIRYSRMTLGVKTWRGAKIYVASWDADEFGRYRALVPTASAGQIGGGNPTDPHVLDDIYISLLDGDAQ